MPPSDTVTPLAPGTRLGKYEIVGLLGEGGMGQVYRARDTDLGRHVAIKLLQPRYAGDEEWVARFRREAQLLASLKHDHIATLYSLEQVDGVRFLVMELVEGPTLAAHLRHAPLPLDQALKVCGQIAEALEYAHSRGVVHRDLKPANVKLTTNQQVKVLDFGLAKTVRAVVVVDSEQPTAEHFPQTEEGMIVGTPAYMSPEQARGERPDEADAGPGLLRLSDVWSFGCILYECLSGQRAFAGGTRSDLLAAVLKDTPDWKALPDLPPRVTALLRRCLQKDPRRRHHCLTDARLEIEETLEELKRPAPPGQPARPRASLLYAAASAAVAAGLFFGLGWWARPPASGERWIGREMLDGSTSVISPRADPDGKRLAFSVLQGKQTQIGVMDLLTGHWEVRTQKTDLGMINGLTWSPSGTTIYYDRYFDRPNGIYTTLPPGGGAPEIAEELFLDGAECPEVLSDGTVFYCRPDGKGRSQFFTRKPGQAERQAFDHPVELTPGWPPPAVRALHRSEAVVFCGTVFDGSNTTPQRHLYHLDLKANRLRLVYRPPLRTSVPIAVSHDDRFLYTVLPEADVYRVVRMPLETGPAAEPQVIWSLTSPVMSVEVDGQERVYFVPSPRPRELLKVPVKGGLPERLGNVLRDNDVQPAELSGGRYIRPGKVLGRDRLSVCPLNGYPVPLLRVRDEPGETRPPLALVGRDRVAFVYHGAGRSPCVRLATLDQRAQDVREVAGVPADSLLTVLAASPDGNELYYIHNRELYKVRINSEGGSLERLLPGEAVDGIAVHPSGGKLLVQRFSNRGVELFWLPLPAGERVPIQVEATADIGLAPTPISTGAIDSRGRVLVEIARRGEWFWGPGILTIGEAPGKGKIEPVPLDFEGDFWLCTWSRDEKEILGVGHPFRTELWRLERQK